MNNNGENNKDFIFIEPDNENRSGNQGFNINYDPLKEKKKKKKGFFMKGVAATLAGMIIGGTLTTVATFYWIPQSNWFKNTDLYKMVGNKTITAQPNFKEDKDAMTISDVVNKVGPAVVGVSTKSVAYDIFYRKQVSEGMGSGAIISEDGLVLTNFHVINGAQTVKVILNDGKGGKEVNAKVVNYDEARDIAIVKITEDIKMPAVAALGDSDSLLPGQQVIAIGNPLGKELLGTVTSGIISAVNRDIADETGKKQKFIQTDTAINRGNSGGPLINAKGEVIGVNTLKQAGEGVEGLGFAIPINEIKGKLESLSKAPIKIGVIINRNIDSETAKANKVPEGVLIQEVQEFSPAAKAGVQGGDIITGIDGVKTKTLEEFKDKLSKHKPGDTVKVDIYRNDKNMSVNIKLE